MKLSAQKIEEIVELARRGYHLNEVARQTNVSPITVRKHCHLNGVILKPGVLPRWTESMKDQAVDLYRSGRSIARVATQMKSGQRQVTTYLKERGVQLRSRGQSGEKNQFWTGGRVHDKYGYVLVYAPNHPYRRKNNKVAEHRLVVEKELGRFLKPREVVDHINGVKDDNRPENLRVFPSNAEHLRATLKGRVPKWSEEGRARMTAGHEAWRLRHKQIRSKLDAGQ